MRINSLISKKFWYIKLAVVLALGFIYLLSGPISKVQAWGSYNTGLGYYYGKSTNGSLAKNILSCGINNLDEGPSQYNITDFVNTIGFYYFYGAYFSPTNGNISHAFPYWNFQIPGNISYDQQAPCIPYHDSYDAAQDHVGAATEIQMMMDFSPHNESVDEPCFTTDANLPNPANASCLTTTDGTIPDPSTDIQAPEIGIGPDTDTNASDYLSGADYHGSWVALVIALWNDHRLNLNYTDTILKNSDYDPVNQDIVDSCDSLCLAGTTVNVQTIAVLSSDDATQYVQFAMMHLCGNIVQNGPITNVQMPISGTAYLNNNSTAFPPISGRGGGIGVLINYTYTDNGTTTSSSTTTNSSGNYSFTVYFGDPFSISAQTNPISGVGQTFGPTIDPMPPNVTSCSVDGGPPNTSSYLYETAGDTNIGSGQDGDCNRPDTSGFDFLYTTTVTSGVSCISTSIQPALPSPGQTFNAFVTFSVTGSKFSGNIKLNGSGAGSISPSLPITQSVSNQPVGNDRYSFPELFSANTPGSYTLTGTVGSTNCQATITIGYTPYFQAQGGDITSGTTVGPSACVTADGAGVYGPDSLSNPTIGSQLAIYALGDISGYASDNGAGNGAGLDFANATAPYGNFGNPPCMPDYAFPPTCTTAASANIDPTVAPNNTCFSGNSSTNSAGVSVPPNTPGSTTNVTIYVEGNLAIPSNIAYSSAWNSPGSIPSVTFVVQGNIYISPAVTELDGNYYSAKTIYTCTNANYSAITGPYAGGGGTASHTQPNCGGGTHTADQLTVNGSFMAKKIEFQRTNGDINGAGGVPQTPAETFNYGPAEWLSGYSASNVGGQYQNISVLPPIL